MRVGSLEAPSTATERGANSGVRLAKLSVRHDCGHSPDGECFRRQCDPLDDMAASVAVALPLAPFGDAID